MRKPPAFFLSSTVHDFKDLRSAIKYHLEQRGCVVNASEYSDFSKPLDTHTYDACLQAIRQSDWFILLIGFRVGGWYDEAGRISITQQEYREAYKLHLQGKIRLLIFVRAEVWQFKEDRKELSGVLERIGIDPQVKDVILKHPTKAAADADFIIKLIDEVGRNQETLAARKGAGQFPTGNWIHVFSTFKDVADAIRFESFASHHVDDLALRRLLKRELLEFLRVSLVRTRSHGLATPRRAVDDFHANHHLRFEDTRMERFEVNTRMFDELCSFAIGLINTRYQPRVLPRAIESSAFVAYDQDSGVMREEPVYDALIRLADEIRIFGITHSAELLRPGLETEPQRRSSPRETSLVRPKGLVRLLHVLDRCCNIISLCRAVISHLDGKPFSAPSLRPSSIFFDVNEEETRDRPSDRELDEFLAS